MDIQTLGVEESKVILLGSGDGADVILPCQK
jgi:hypothetical protein